MKNFLKGILVGIGGVSPGLSGSVMMVIFGLYEKVINSIGNIFKNFKENLKFLIPVFAGFGVGILLFSKVVDFALSNYEMYTRYLFFGLIVGTIPMFYKSAKKKGFEKKHYIIIITAFLIGILLFIFKGSMPRVENPSIFQSLLLGVAVAGSTIVPGVDSAVILSGLGLYELYVSSIANLNFSVLLPAGISLGLSALVIANIMSKLIKNHYATTMATIFGLFLAITPSVFTKVCALAFNFKSFVAILFAIIGYMISFFFEKVSDNK